MATALLVGCWSTALAQEPATLDPPATPEVPVVEPIATEEAAPEATIEEAPPVEPSSEEAAPEDSAPSEPAEEPPAATEADAVADSEQPPAETATEETAPDEEAAEEEGAEEVVTAQPIDWEGIVERAPAFFSVLHPVVVHFPIALWIVGAFFVLVGLVIPSWGRQIPFACLLLGTLGTIGSTLTGWWNADENGWEGWREFDWESGFCQHRWLGVVLVAASVVLSWMAIHSMRRDSSRGFLWRVGLIALALAVGYEGHLGGDLVHSTSIEEALVEWLNLEE